MSNFTSSDSYKPIIIEHRKTAVEVNEVLTMWNNRLVLTEIPDEFQKVYIDGYTEVENKIPSQGEYRVNYITGIIQFGGDNESGETFNVSYFGKGFVQYPADRIYINRDGNDTERTLKDVIDIGYEGIEALTKVNNVVAQEEIRNTNEILRNQNENNRSLAEVGRNSSESIRVADENTRKTQESQRISAETSRAGAESTRVSQENTRKSQETSRVNAESLRVTAESARVAKDAERTTNENARLSQETTRQSNETSRVNAEASRVSVESARVTAENTRVSQENTRKSQETSRINAETARATAESTRVTQEDARKLSETARVTSEEARKLSEDERVSSETTRKTSESLRISAEDTRKTNETSRISSESSRATAETARVGAENTRVTQENTRKSQETSRANAETTRVSQETSRVNAETARVSAETDRASAETARVNSENDRDDAEDVRVASEEVRETNETDRISEENARNTQENARNSAESTRVTQENARKSQETSRVNAETARVSAETTRVTDENTRKTQETARQTAESTRVTQENARKTAETARVNAENLRTSSETARSTAENTREDNEDLRIDNESARMDSESTRNTNEEARLLSETQRVNAESTRVTQENTRKTQETSRVNAETTRQSQESARQTNTQTAINNANTATQNAVTATNNVNLHLPKLINLESKNTYASTTTYSLNNIVNYEGSSFISLVNNNTNNTPSTSPNSFWGLLALKGLDGRGSIVTVNGIAPDANGNLTLELTTTWSQLQEKPTQFPPSPHAHPISDVTGLQTALNAKANLTHVHAVSDVTGLQTALDGKLASTANAVSASKLATPRTIALSGDVTGSIAFDGSANVNIVTTIADDSHNHVIGNIDGLQSALDLKASIAYVDAEIAELIGSAPETLNALNELASALGNDPNFATTMTNQLGNKVDKVAGKQLSTEDYTTAEKSKLAGVAINANNYIHPSHTARTISVDTAGAEIIDVISFTSDASGHVTSASATKRTLTLADLGYTGSTNANSYSHPTGDGNLHVPATGTSNNGKVLKAGATAGSLSWSTLGFNDMSDVNLSGLSSNQTLNYDGTRWVNSSSPNAKAFLSEGFKTSKATAVNQWTKIASISLTAQNQVATTKIIVVGGEDAGATGTSPVANIFLRVSQTSAMASAPVIGLRLMENQNITINEFKTVTSTNTASSTVVDLYVNLKDLNETFTFIPLVVNGYSRISYLENQPLVTTLPAGTQTSAVYDMIESSALPSATTTTQGAVIISTSTSDTSTTKVASASAVKSAYDLANSKLASNANAVSATKLLTARTIALAGDITGSATFDGTSNITITAVVADNSHLHAITDITGLQTALDGKLGSTSNAVSATKLATARTISLGGDLSGSTSFDGSGNVTITAVIADDSHNHGISTINGLQIALDGKLDATSNAVSSSKWATPRTITLSGDLSGSVSIDGSSNVTLSAQVADDSHNHTIANIDGLQTTLDGKAPTGFGLGQNLSVVQKTTSVGLGTGFSYYASGATDKPSGVTDGAMLSMTYDSNLWYSQIFADWRTNTLYTRAKNSGTWSSYSELDKVTPIGTVQPTGGESMWYKVVG